MDLDTYKYDELPQGDFIRYLTLHAGQGTDPLECNLHTARSSETEFEAVSYVWGSDVRDQEIFCDGKVLALTTNLSRVLRRENLDEKGRQVAIMGQIYRHASQVLIHMGGNDNGHGPQVVSLLDTVCGTIERILPLLRKDWNTFPYPEASDAIFMDPRWDSLGVLLDETWFTRGWVVREAGLARDGQVYWGQSEFSWNSLMRTCNFLYKRATKLLYAKSFDSKIPLAHVELFEDRHQEYAKLFTSEMTWVHSSVLGYLSLTRQLSLKDPRDRIYAFIELVEDEQRQVHLKPNYEDHFLHVYQQFATEYIRTKKYIGLLSDVEHDAQSLESGIPSWVPRWDLPLTRTGYAFAPADSGYLALTSGDGSIYEPTVTEENTLSTRGVVFDTVIYASKPLNMSTTTIDVITDIFKDMKKLATDSPYTRKNQLNVFITALTAATREAEIVDWLRSQAAYYQAIREKHGDLGDLEAPNWLAKDGTIDLFHHTVKGYTHNRKLILTKRGYIGLAPAVAQEGDLCGILFGCTTPCILRVSRTANSYKYLGAAYVVGRYHWQTTDGRVVFSEILGAKDSKEWMLWGIAEQDITLC
ncbi:hypothetical protein BDU57DRAFT_518621 [Ampelomyces quisqualis]|uniref:Heterokaryon incompatibility domain-containing protein n=1 Tax=Ampelomyces quisqualis TaxID=50730 RepID=A0A6A5QNF3_AMPQU|nr:hypothetical protein BDU57DRAFT_518621 [Ampelomyces quisqualis]